MHLKNGSDDDDDPDNDDDGDRDEDVAGGSHRLEVDLEEAGGIKVVVMMMTTTKFSLIC